MDDGVRTNERAQFAWIGIGLTFALVVTIGIIATGEWWAWLLLGAPVSIILSAVTRLRRIRATGVPD